MKAMVIVLMRPSEAVPPSELSASDNVCSPGDTTLKNLHCTGNSADSDKSHLPFWTWFLENPRLSQFFALPDRLRQD